MQIVVINAAVHSNFSADDYFLKMPGRATMRRINTSAVPQLVRWGPSDTLPAGIRVMAKDSSEVDFVEWPKLSREIEQNLMPQLFANPKGFKFALHDHNGKRDWLVQVRDVRGEWYCDVWFGNAPEHGWRFDGLIRVGDPNDSTPVWQTYQRYSDGTYRRGNSLTGTIDALPRSRRT
jgi:hypothetical protein